MWRGGEGWEEKGQRRSGQKSREEQRAQIHFLSVPLNPVVLVYKTDALEFGSYMFKIVMFLLTVPLIRMNEKSSSRFNLVLFCSILRT